MDGWTFRAAHATGGTITSTAGFQIGPAGQPAGSGSAKLTTGPDGDSFAELRNVNYNGVKLSDLTQLTYWSYVTAKTLGSCVTGYILLSVDVDGDGVFDPVGGPDDGIFFEPCYQTGEYLPTEPPGQIIPNQCPNLGDPLCFSEGQWVSWDALNGGWWSANYGCQGGPPLTLFSTYLAQLALRGYPSPKIINSDVCLGGVRLRAGPGAGAWPNFDGNVDKFVIGASGVNGGMNITYDFEFEPLPIPACGVTAETGTINACKFYDSNANSVRDPGEPSLDGWPITISPLGSAIPNVATQFTSDGCVTWANLNVLFNPYTISEGTPNQTNWVHSTPSSVNVNVANNTTSAVKFGNYCTASSGGLTIGFWGNKNGQALITSSDLALLRSCNLVNANGTPFNPTTKAQLMTWLQNANATNMAYMLSAQLAAMKLSVAHGFVDGSSFAICAGKTINQLISMADAALGLDGFTPAGDPNRNAQQQIKNCLDTLNNGGLVVPSTPCPASFALQSPQALGVSSQTRLVADPSRNVKAMFP